MDVNLRELIAALPGEDALDPGLDAELAQERLQEIFRDLARRPVPVHSLPRLWTLGELSAQIALAYLSLWMRQWFADAETRQRRLMETNLRLALEAFHRLGYLRGAIMKLGQAAGNLPNILPGEIVETLERLHLAAPPMHFSLIRELLHNELGGEPEELFERFDRDAFAAASLGQVHRARLKSGEDVAVKIQYPGIARTIDADFRNLSALLFPMRLGKDWEWLQASFEEIRRMLNQEVDYLHEAESLREARRLFEPADGIVVPRVFPERSTARVLTMEYLPGLHLREFLAADPPQDLRDRFGTKMYVVCARMYNAHMNHADPHSGNYVFMEDGRLGLLDFGCVQHFDAEEREIFEFSDQLWNGMDALPEVLRRAAGATETELANADYIESVAEATRWLLETAVQPGPFDFGDPAHLQRGVEIFTRLIRKRYTRSHPMYIYFYRSVFGLRAVLYRLRARVDVGAVFGRR